MNYLEELEEEALAVVERLAELGEHPDLIIMDESFVWDVSKKRMTSLLRKGSYQAFDWYKLKKEKGL